MRQKQNGAPPQERRAYAKGHLLFVGEQTVIKRSDETPLVAKCSLNDRYLFVHPILYIRRIFQAIQQIEMRLLLSIDFPESTSDGTTGTVGSKDNGDVA